MPAAAAQDEEAQQRDVVVPGDRLLASGAMGARADDGQIERPAIERVKRQLQQRELKKLAGLKVTSMEDLDGIKLHFGDSAWLLVRASGTENLLRLYAETPSRGQTNALLEEMAAIAKGQA